MGRTAGSTSSTEASVRAPTRAPHGVALGRVVGAHGLRGELRVRLLDEDDSNLRAAPRVILGREEGDPKAVEALVRAVGSGRRGEVRLALEGVDSREEALALRGCSVSVRSEHLAALGPGEYYQYELVGCRVEDADGRDLGVVTGIWETGAPALLVVEAHEARDREKGAERLIPAAPGILRDVDVEGRRIAIDAPAGLIESAADPEPR